MPLGVGAISQRAIVTACVIPAGERVPVRRKPACRRGSYLPIMRDKHGAGGMAVVW